MKIRNIPFGYAYVDGKKIKETNESQVVIEIFVKYLKGESLKNIADSLNEQKIEYMSGVIGWNKARIRHIIEDKRYMGENGYPMIIATEVFAKAQELKQIKNTQKDTDRSADIFNLNVLIRCPLCGNSMHRFCASRLKLRERWVCTNEECKKLIIKADDELLNDITELLNKIIRNPKIIVYTVKQEIQQLQSVENIDIKNSLINNNGENLRKKLYENASAKYKQINFDVLQTDYIKDVLEKYHVGETLPRELLDKIANDINLYEDGTIGIVLINNQEIKGG